MLDQILFAFDGIDLRIFSMLVQRATAVFGTFLFLELAWRFATWAVEPATSSSPLRPVLSTLVPCGILISAFLGYQAWFGPIVESFFGLGQDLTGWSGLSPTAIVGQGLVLAGTVWKQSHLLWMVPETGLVRALVPIIIIVCYGMAAIRVLEVLIEWKILMGSGVLLLGLGASRWTFGLTKALLGAHLHLALKAFFLFVILSASGSLAVGWVEELRSFWGLNIMAYGRVLVAAIAFGYITWTLPERLATRFSDSFQSSFPNLGG